jgi:ABC-2 type transport system ATP-binding protein
MIKVENLSLNYGNQVVLNDVTFSLNKNQIIGLLGPNGAGKSSIIKILAGLVSPCTGNLLINDELQPFSDLRNCCGYLIDGPSYYPYLTAIQNLNLIRKINNSDVNLEDLLIKVGLKDVDNKRVKHFSTGMKQRLAIAIAIMNSPELLILDEPFNGLDPNGFQELITLLKNLNKNGTTILVSSHLLNELEQFADYFILIHQGKIAMDISNVDLQQSDKKVMFTFGEIPNQKAKGFLQDKNATFINDKKAVVSLKANEIAEMVNLLVDQNCTPINIETSTILQEKYFNITA